MVKKILDTILFCNFCFAFSCTKGRKEYLRRSLPYLVGHELSYILCLIAIVVITKFEYKLPEFVVILLLFVIVSLSFYCTKKAVFQAYDKKELARRYDKLKPRTGIFTFIGFLLFAGSLIAFMAIAFSLLPSYGQLK